MDILVAIMVTATFGLTALGIGYELGYRRGVHKSLKYLAAKALDVLNGDAEKWRKRHGVFDCRETTSTEDFELRNTGQKGISDP